MKSPSCARVEFERKGVARPSTHPSLSICEAKTFPPSCLLPSLLHETCLCLAHLVRVDRLWPGGVLYGEEQGSLPSSCMRACKGTTLCVTPPGASAPRSISGGGVARAPLKAAVSNMGPHPTHQACCVINGDAYLYFVKELHFDQNPPLTPAQVETFATTVNNKLQHYPPPDSGRFIDYALTWPGQYNIFR